MAPMRSFKRGWAAAVVLTMACTAPSEQERGGTRSQEYDRREWQHWIDDDGDCQDTRTEVLVAESAKRVRFEDRKKCKVTRGEWICPYTGKVISDPGQIDVDHMVPLGNAHRSNGHSWDASRRRRYANDLEHDDHLIAVDRGANRSKGDKGPEAWLPPNAEYRCDYVRDWVAIKERWELSMTDEEDRAVGEALEVCERGEVPELPQHVKRAEPAKE